MKTKALFISAILFFFNLPSISWAANGYFVHGVGAVNEALGGTATAGNTQDVIGSLYRNPATAGLFQGSAGSVSLGLILPDATIKSSVSALGLSGSSDSDVDMIPISNMAMVFNNEKSNLAWYFAVIAEAGLHLNMRQSNTNPVFIAQAGKPDNPFGGIFGGFGNVETQMEVIRLPIGFSRELNNKWTIGVSAAPSVARLQFTPTAFADPDDADGNGAITYPTDVDHQLAFGMGFQAGLHCRATNKVGIGVSLASPTWFEAFEWDVTDELGYTRQVSHHVDRPMTLHLGFNYQITPETLLLLDASWINYSGTAGFDETGFNADGSLKGLGWDDQWVLAMGIQHDLTNSWTLRAGYNYGTSPFDDDRVFFNVGTPLHNEHHLSLGTSWRVSEKAVIDFGYTHAFESSESGPWYDGTNVLVAGTNVESSLAYDQLAIGMTFKF